MQESQSTRLINLLTRILLNNPSVVRRIALGLGVFATAVFVRLAIGEELLKNVRYITFFPAVLVVAIWAGTLPAVCILVACTIYAWVTHPDNAAGWAPVVAMSALFFVIGGIIITLIYALRRSIILLQASERAALAIGASRDLMFHELKHRVSNNLQMIASTLSVQRRGVTDSAAGAIIDAAIARIQTVANVQRHLSNLTETHVDILKLLLATLPDAARVSQGALENVVQLNVTGKGVTLCRERAMLGALVATELVSNSVEHGGQIGARLQIEVTTGTLPDKIGFVEVRDNGPGYPTGLNENVQKSTGLRLAFLFAQQLEGQLILSSAGGAVARVEFPLGTEAEIPILAVEGTNRTIQFAEPVVAGRGKFAT